MANTHCVDLELSSSQYLSITDGAQTGLDITGDFTFEFWLKLEQLPSTGPTTMAILGKDDSTDSSNRAYFVNVQGSGTYTDKLSAGWFDPSSNYSRFYLDTALVAGDVGSWVHWAIAVDVSGPSATAYRNGSSVSTTFTNTAATSVRSGTTQFLVGAALSGTPHSYFDGRIDDLRVWSDIRTQQEVQDNRSIELVGNEAGLVGYWKLNNSLLDETSNNNDLTNNNSATFPTDPAFTEATGNPWYAYAQQ